MSFNRKSFSIKKKKAKTYNVINNFENISEKNCIKLDKENEYIYKKLLLKAKQAQHTIENSGLYMNLEVPIPPRPNNRDRFILWNKRNIEKHVIKQTEAVIYLENNGYKFNEHYEAYQAIDLYNEIKKKKFIKTKYIDTTKNFDNLYTEKDKNILRIKSMYGIEQLKSNELNNQSDCNNLNELYNKNNTLNSYGILNNKEYKNEYTNINNQNKKEEDKKEDKEEEDKINCGFRNNHLQNVINDNFKIPHISNFDTYNNSNMYMRNQINPSINNVYPSAPPQSFNNIIEDNSMKKQNNSLYPSY